MEPVYLELGDSKITEHGKRWLDRQSILRDVFELACAEAHEWPRVLRGLKGPLAITSGVSQYEMQQLINASTKQATYTAPGVFSVALASAAPATTSTGASMSETTYTGYARTSATMAAASNATPSVAQNSATVTFPNCTAAGPFTLLGFVVCDSATLAAGNALWFGALTSTTISNTQTPPTIAANALSVQMTGT